MVKLWGRRLPRKFVYGVGFYTLCSYTYDMAYASVMHNNRPRVDFKTRYGQNTYAVVAGATSDTGK